MINNYDKDFFDIMRSYLWFLISCLLQFFVGIIFQLHVEQLPTFRGGEVFSNNTH